jgi:hypothetical protein
MGLIKTPHLLMKKRAAHETYINLGEHDRADIEAISFVERVVSAFLVSLPVSKKIRS